MTSLFNSKADLQSGLRLSGQYFCMKHDSLVPHELLQNVLRKFLFFCPKLANELKITNCSAGSSYARKKFRNRADKSGSVEEKAAETSKPVKEEKEDAKEGSPYFDR